MNTNDDSKIFLTKEAIKDLKDELKRLIEVDRPEAIQEIKDARAQGDLSENAEYDAAREKQGQVEDRISEIEKILEQAEEINRTNKKNVVATGSIVTLKNKFNNSDETYSIVSTFEANPFENKISNKSPLALSLIGKSKGDVVIVDAPTKYEVEILNIK